MAEKVLVAVFSASGVTRRIGQEIARISGGDFFEIEPEEHYTAADLDWMDRNSRSSVEMNDASARPAVRNRVPDMDSYDTVIIGFPIWWGIAPRIIETFLEEYDFSGKTIIPFCSHGGGRFGQSLTAIAKLAPDAVMGEGLSVHYSGGTSLPDDVSAWLETNGIKH